VNIATALEITLATVVLGVAVWTIVAHETSSAVVGFITYGLLLALIWVRPRCRRRGADRSRNRRRQSVVRQIRMLRSVGAGGG